MLRSCIFVQFCPSSEEPPFVSVTDFTTVGFACELPGWRKMACAPSMTKSTFGRFTAFLWKCATPLFTWTVPGSLLDVLQIQKDLPAFRLSVSVWPFSASVVTG